MIGIYCRISRVKDGNDLSIDDQREKGITKAKELGIPYKLYIDEGLSGASDKIEDRPQFEKFLSDVSTNVLTHVYAYDQSRFERNPQIRFVINDLFKKHNITYITHLDGVVDLHDPQSEFFGDLLSVINKYHVTTTKLKVKSALTLRAKQGKGKGTLPFGYMMDSEGYIVINEEQAVHVRRVYELSLKGLGCNSISHLLNDENVPTVYSSKAKDEKVNYRWSPSSVRNLIINSFYKGERIYNKEVLKVPAIIDPLYWQQVNDHLVLNRNNSGKKVTHQFLLKGLLKCGVCGKNYYGRRRLSNGDNHYNCGSKRYKGEGCTNKGINISRIDDFIWEHLFSRDGLAKRIEQEFKFDNHNIAQLEEKIVKHKEKIERISAEKSRAIGLVVKGIVSEKDLAGTLNSIESEAKAEKILLDDAEQKLLAFKISDDLVSRYRDIFSKFNELATFEQKKEIVNNFIHSITLLWLDDKKEFLIDIKYRVEIPNDLYFNKTSKTTDDFYKYFDENDKEDVVLYTKPLNKASENSWEWEEVDLAKISCNAHSNLGVQEHICNDPLNYSKHPCF